MSYKIQTQDRFPRPSQASDATVLQLGYFEFGRALKLLDGPEARWRDAGGEREPALVTRRRMW